MFELAFICFDVRVIFSLPKSVNRIYIYVCGSNTQRMYCASPTRHCLNEVILIELLAEKICIPNREIFIVAL